jgi:hypothetical protein
LAREKRKFTKFRIYDTEVTESLITRKSVLIFFKIWVFQKRIFYTKLETSLSQSKKELKKVTFRALKNIDGGYCQAKGEKECGR